MSLYGAIQRIETACAEQPILYEWPSPHAPEYTAAVVYEQHSLQPIGLWLLFGSCDDESPDSFANEADALAELHLLGPPPLCLRCEDDGCVYCHRNPR